MLMMLLLLLLLVVMLPFVVEEDGSGFSLWASVCHVLGKAG